MKNYILYIFTFAFLCVASAVVFVSSIGIDNFFQNVALHGFQMVALYALMLLAYTYISKLIQVICGKLKGLRVIHYTFYPFCYTQGKLQIDFSIANLINRNILFDVSNVEDESTYTRTKNQLFETRALSAKVEMAFYGVLMGIYLFYPNIYLFFLLIMYLASRVTSIYYRTNPHFKDEDTYAMYMVEETLFTTMTSSYVFAHYHEILRNEWKVLKVNHFQFHILILEELYRNSTNQDVLLEFHEDLDRKISRLIELRDIDVLVRNRLFDYLSIRVLLFRDKDVFYAQQAMKLLDEYMEEKWDNPIPDIFFVRYADLKDWMENTKEVLLPKDYRRFMK